MTHEIMFRSIDQKAPMSTRARIGIVNADKSITSIYTHSDGYISHHGPILLNHYNTEGKIRALLGLGSLSVLGKELGEKHDFNTPWGTYPNWCKAYHRDRDEELEVTLHKTRRGFLSATRNCNAEWMYLFENSVWSVSRTSKANWNNLEAEYILQRLTA